MNKRRLALLLGSVGVLFFIWNELFIGPNNIKKEEIMQQNPETHKFEKVLPFEIAYVDKTSNIGELFGALPLNEYKDTFNRDLEHYSFSMDYDVTAEELGKIVEKSVVYNTTVAFTLISNLEEVEMRFQDKSFIVTRENVEKWFRTTLVDLKDPLTFKERVQDKLDEDIEHWIVAYTED